MNRFLLVLDDLATFFDVLPNRERVRVTTWHGSLWVGSRWLPRDEARNIWRELTGKGWSRW